MRAEATDRIEVVQGDITTLDVEAIVNAANDALAPGGGVCGAIHGAAGPELEAECTNLGHCPTGEARLTKGYRLPARFVIHAVGPRYKDGRHGEAALLRSAYEESLRLAAQYSIKTIAFPGISTGIYGYPLDEACIVAIKAVAGWLRANALPERVTLCTFNAETAELYRRRLREFDAS